MPAEACSCIRANCRYLYIWYIFHRPLLAFYSMNKKIKEQFYLIKLSLCENEGILTEQTAGNSGLNFGHHLLNLRSFCLQSLQELCNTTDHVSHLSLYIYVRF